jgi:hypothetical protein
VGIKYYVVSGELLLGINKRDGQQVFLGMGIDKKSCNFKRNEIAA